MSLNNANVLLVAYKQAEHDADEITQYVNSLSSSEQMNLDSMPSLVGNMSDVESASTKRYIQCASVVSGGVAAAVTASVSTAALFSLTGASGTAALGAMAWGGAAIVGGTFPVVGLFAIPFVGITLARKILSDAKVKKYLKAEKDALCKKQKNLKASRDKLLKWYKEANEKATKLDRELRENIKIKFWEYSEKTKKFAKEVSVQIDDVINTNTNKRIMQYNQVILNQASLQKELEEKVDYLLDEYNKVLIQKEELERQIGCLIKLLNAMSCPEAVIDQALNGGEKE